MSSLEELYKDRERLIREIRRSVEKVKQRRDVERVILFGSIATNSYSFGSDADILVILKESKHKRFFDRIPEFLELIDLPIPFEVFPLTKEEVKRSSFMQRAVKDGVEL